MVQPVCNVWCIKWGLQPESAALLNAYVYWCSCPRCSWQQHDNLKTLRYWTVEIKLLLTRLVLFKLQPGSNMRKQPAVCAQQATSD
jgi:hypothetical protein